MVEQDLRIKGLVELRPEFRTHWGKLGDDRARASRGVVFRGYPHDWLSLESRKWANDHKRLHQDIHIHTALFNRSRHPGGRSLGSAAPYSKECHSRKSPELFRMGCRTGSRRAQAKPYAE